MASRLPVLVSSQCGCIPDLVNEGINGYIFNPTDIKNLIALMLLVSGKSSDELCRMGDESLKIISYFGLSRFSDNLWEAAGCAIKTKTFGFMDGLLIKFLFKAREGL
jgi:glycosyltransferase involved in cell wall biosynthesis